MAYEIWDYLPATPVSPDYNYTLTIKPQVVLVEKGEKKQKVHKGDDKSRITVSPIDDSDFYFLVQYANLDADDGGTIFDLWHDTSKANGFARTWKFQRHDDGHTYVVRFESEIERSIHPDNHHQITQFLLHVEGRDS